MIRRALKVVATIVAFSLLLLAVGQWKGPEATRQAEASPAQQIVYDEAGSAALAILLLSERTWNGADAGRPVPLLLDPNLAAQARMHALRLAACDCTYHSPQGERDWWAGRGWSGGISENVAGGFGSVHEAHRALMRSPNHLRNILDRNVRGVGVAAARGADGRWYVVQFFGWF